MGFGSVDDASDESAKMYININTVYNATRLLIIILLRLALYQYLRMS
jgi:hypothetical protein